MRLIGVASIVCVLALTFAISGFGPAATAHQRAGQSRDDDERRGQAIFRFDTFGDEQLWTDVLRMHEVMATAIDARATRRAAGVRSAIEAAGTVYAPERLHEVRIAVKKLRYALELGAEARSQRTNANLRALRSGQDLLGRPHDVEVLVGRARREQATLTPPTLPVWRQFDSLIAALEDECRTLHAAYTRDRANPIAIADSISDPKSHTVVTRRAVG